MARVQNALKPVAPSAKWVAPELCHITLKFLGYVEADQVPAIAQTCRAAAAAVTSFGLSVQGVGAFPGWRGARVLWMGLQDGVSALTALQATLEGGLATLGFRPEDRPFSPHLTVARFKQPPASTLEPTARAFEHECFGTILVNELRLMRSDRRPSGPIYTVLEAFPLGASF
jgi:RNA 2',3'-cyclic 3'-phosphodiesterase